MPVVLSNQLKALLVMEDVTEEGVNVWQNSSFTVQHFSYQCRYQRNDAGMPYGPTLPSFLDFTVKISSNESAQQLFERMSMSESFPYSFLFNASFNANRRLAECEDAMVVRGFLVELDEAYDDGNPDKGTQEQMLVRCRLLVCNIAYQGREDVLKLTITND